MKQLHEYGYGNREQTESFINREVQETCDYIDTLIDTQDGVIVPEFLFNVANVNVVWGLASGTRFNHKDPKMLKLMDCVMDLIRYSELAGGIQSAYPFMLDWCPGLLQFPKVQEVNRKFQAFFREIIQEYRQAGAFRFSPKNFIEIFLQRIDIANKDNPGIFTDENLIAVLYDFLAGSILTTAETLIYAVLQFALHPEMQERMRNEIDTVFGKSRLSSVSEKQRTPFCTAFILEVLRLSTVVPLAPRKVYKDTSFGDYIIPKDTNLLINYYSIHMDKEFWGDPENFRPDRFLNEESSIINSDHIMSFSAGKRSCFGEPIAQANIYLFLTQLLQRFTFRRDADNTPPSAEFKPGLIVRLQPFSLLVKRRDYNK
ncbi:unnamed protein product [Allacma fusca]|uniref:Cytochrome P450 n=1 Tax=Allacma fusca TaxID=39272 RepID=A0A8J2NYK7_9HEXA|nr:unnamed protein product [Allacma fusca]